jgi:3-mercaptopyruvate sulfurtransferase SseA
MVENRKNPLPWVLVGVGALLLLAGLAWLVLNQQVAVVVTPTPALVEQVERVPLDDAKAAFESGKAVYLDVRASSSFEASHIPGAVSIPLNDLPTRMGELDPGSWIIPY